VCLEYINKYWY